MQSPGRGKAFNGCNLFAARRPHLGGAGGAGKAVDHHRTRPALPFPRMAIHLLQAILFSLGSAGQMPRQAHSPLPAPFRPILKDVPAKKKISSLVVDPVHLERRTDGWLVSELTSKQPEAVAAENNPGAFKRRMKTWNTYF